MKRACLLSVIAAALAAVTSSRAGEHFTLIAEKPAIGTGESASITLNAGDTAELKFASGGGDFRMVATIEGSNFEMYAVRAIASLGPIGTATTINPIKIVGPASIKMKLGSDQNNGTEKQFATIEVNRAGTAGTPAAIPLEAGTTWQVLLEASTDLVNWAPVAPGDYPSASPQRFFRTRLVKRQ